MAKGIGQESEYVYDKERNKVDGKNEEQNWNNNKARVVLFGDLVKLRTGLMTDAIGL